MAGGFTGEQQITKERKKFIFQHLRKGKLPKEVIELVMEEYNLGEDRAEQLVYGCTKELKDRLKDLADNAAEYLMNNVQSLAAQALEDGDRKTAIKSYELLAKICKVGQEDPRTTVNINFGFDFSDDREEDRD